MQLSSAASPLASLRWLDLIAAACFALAAGGALADEPKITLVKRGETFVLDATLAFPVPLRTAWEVLTDYDRMTEILDNLISSRIVSRSGNTWVVQQEGVARYGPFSYSFFSEREVRLEPMKRIHSRQLVGNARRFVSGLELSETADGTSGRYHAEMIPDSGLARTFGGPFIVHEVEEQFQAMSAEMLRRKSP